MSKIARIRARFHRVPVTIPLIDRPIDNWGFVSCEVETTDGVRGFGITGRQMPRALVTAINDDIAPVLVGASVLNVEAAQALVLGKLNSRAQTGVVCHALAAVDIAIWDAKGKTQGRSIAAMLGGFSDRAAAYVTFGFPDYDREQLVEAARHQLSLGIENLKMVVAAGGRDWREDVRRVRAVRDAIGPDVGLAIDANYMLSPLHARYLGQAIDELDIAWFEEPLQANDPRCMAELRREIRTPISAGQMDGHRWRLREFVTHESVDILQPNVCYSGGFTESQKVAHLAQCFSLPIMNGGGYPHFNMHLIAGVQNGMMVEFHLAMQQVGEFIFKDAPGIVDNHVAIPDAPGLGMEIDTDFLDASQVEG